MEILAEAYKKVAVIADYFTSQGKTLAVAESCTGGLLSHLLTEFPGASKFFLGSVVCYQNEVKQRLLGVKTMTLRRYGAVSNETAAQMAMGVLNKLQSDVAIAISGIAGPSGGSSQKPVGTVFIGWASKEAVITFNFLFKGNRSEIKALSAMKALDIIIQEISV